MPFGISIAFLAHTFLDLFLNRLLWIPKHYLILRNLLIIGMQLILLAGSIYLSLGQKGIWALAP